MPHLTSSDFQTLPPVDWSDFGRILSRLLGRDMAPKQLRTLPRTEVRCLAAGTLFGKLVRAAFRLMLHCMIRKPSRTCWLRGKLSNFGCLDSCGMECQSSAFRRRAHSPGSCTFSGPAKAATLYPGRKHPFMWTHFELQLVQMTLFELVLRQQLFNVTLNADAMSASGAQTRL